MYDKMSTVHPSAQIHESTVIHPNCFIGENVTIGAHCVIGPNALIIKDTHIGNYNVIHANAVIGGDSQHKAYNGEPTQLVIGDHNVIRECVTINRGDPVGGSTTRIGNHNLIMAYSHIAHDAIIGNHVVIVNHSNIAGHVIVSDHVVIGAYVGVTQFCRIGQHAFLTEMAFVSKDVLPFCNVGGQPARIRGINLVGLKRRGFSSEDFIAIKTMYRHILMNKPKPDIDNPHAKTMLVFKEESERGLMRPKSLPQVVE